MGIALPQVVTEDRSSGAQVIDGSLKFEASKTQYLKRTNTAGNRTTWTWSAWVKKTSSTTDREVLFSGGNAANDTDWLEFGYDNGNFYAVSNTIAVTSSNVFRDYSAWQHIVVTYNGAQLTFYSNGTEFHSGVRTGNLGINGPYLHTIGKSALTNVSRYFDGYIAEVNFIDGLALDASYFGYTDPLTGTWRPKKYTGDFNVSSSTGASQSTSLSQTGWAVTSPTPQTNIWDGNTSTVSNGYAGGTIGTVTFTPALTGVTKVELFTQNYVHYLNGSSISTPESTNGGWHTYYDNSGSPITLNSVGNAYSNNTQTVDLMAIRINGHIIDSQTWTLPGVTVTTGTNSFYLPMDGNSPIGEDKSGKGNNWTPVNFSGSVALPKATGAKPILNTDGGGNVARVGVFGSEVGFRETVSASSGSGNPYIFDTRGTQPTFNFIRGATYIFDYSGASSHPLKFSTTENGTRNGGTEYTNGRVIDGNVISFTVPHDAPDTLWYYCVNHSGMGNSISITTDETKADPYAWKNVLALPLVGSNSDVSNQINCASTAKVLAQQGNATGSSTQSNFYNGSFYFDGSGDYLGATSNADFAMGTGDFTIECWVYRDSSSAFNNFIGTRGAAGTSAGFTFGAQSNSNGNDIEFYTNGLQLDGGNQTITNGKWHHVAVTRTGTTLSSYVNGILNTTASNSQDFSNTSLAIGMTNDGSQGPMLGYIQDVRIYKGVAKYSGGSVGDQVFIPASTNPDILPDTPSGVSGSSKLAKVTEGAVNFSASGDKLTVSNSSGDFDFGSGDFTIESYLYMTAQSGGDAIINLYNYSSNRRAWNFYHNSSDGNIELLLSTDGSSQISRFESNTPLPKNRWTHVAITKASNVYRMFFDGVQVSTTTVAETIFGTGTTADSVGIGDYAHANVEPYSGFISNVRILKGTALYTSNFTPPTRALTNVTNTKLLCCQSNATSGAAAISPQISGINDGTVWSHQNSFSIAVAGTTETGSLAAVFNSITGTTGAVDSFGFLNGAFDYTYTPNTPIPYSNKVRVWTGFGGNAYLNGGSAVSTTSNNWTTLATGSSGTVSSIRFTASSGGGWWSGLEIDDVMLVDPVNTSGNAAATNFNPFTTDINAVRGQETGYTTWNPLDIQGLDVGDLKDGNLSITHSAGDWLAVRANKFVSSGKWYYEVKVGNNQYTSFGVGSVDYKINPTANDWCNVANVYGFYPYSGKVYDAATGRSYATADTSAAGNVYGIAIDMDNRSLRFYENGRDLGVAFDSTTSTNFVNKESVAPMAWLYNQSGTDDYNFGQKPFKFPPPTGFQSLNAANLRPETVIVRPDHYVGVTTYTGNGASSPGGSGGTQSINVGLEPDLIWIKDRTQAHNNNLLDTIRGVNSILMSDSTVEPVTNSTDAVTSFNSDGFTLGDNGEGTQSLELNKNGNNYVAWTWKSGGSKNTFNVDDVGYASASDVGMNVGGQNSNAYNQDEIWSGRLTVSGGSGTVNSGSGGFGGTDDNTNSTYVNGANSGTNYTITLTPATPISFNDELIVRVEVTHGDAQLNGGNFVTGTNGFVTFKGPGTFTSITSRDNRGQFSGEFYSVRVDGKLLVDTNITPVNVPSIAATGASVGTKQGFSIIKATMGSGTSSFSHGLGQKPAFIIAKNTASTSNWVITHKSLGTNMNDYYLTFTPSNSTNSNGVWGGEPTSTTFSLGTGLQAANQAFVAYLWADVPGLQKFGRYSGISSADGPFIELGFRPSMILLKKIDNTDSNSGWHWYDNQRNTYNPANNFLLADHSYYENRAANNTATVTTYIIDFLSNGFKFRHDSSNLNVAGSNYIYCAWAEAPEFNLYGAQSNAR
jgi:hypothetical protein